MANVRFFKLFLLPEAQTHDAGDLQGLHALFVVDRHASGKTSEAQAFGSGDGDCDWESDTGDEDDDGRDDLLVVSLAEERFVPASAACLGPRSLGLSA